MLRIKQYRIILLYQGKRFNSTRATTTTQENKDAKQYNFVLRNLKSVHSRVGRTSFNKFHQMMRILETTSADELKPFIESEHVERILYLSGEPFVELYRPERQKLTDHLFFNLLPKFIDYSISHYNDYMKVSLYNRVGFDVNLVLDQLRNKDIRANEATNELILWQLCSTKQLNEANEYRAKQCLDERKAIYLNPFLRGYFLANRRDEVFKVYKQITDSNDSANHVNIATYELINGFLMSRDIDEAMKVYKQANSLSLNQIFRLYEDCLHFNCDQFGDILEERLKQAYDNKGTDRSFRLYSANLLSSLFQHGADEKAFKFLSTFFQSEYKMVDANEIDQFRSKNIDLAILFCKYLGKSTNSYEKLIDYHAKLDDGKTQKFYLSEIVLNCLKNTKQNFDLNLKLISCLRDNGVRIREHFFNPFLMILLERKTDDWKELNDFFKKMHNEYKLINFNTDFPEFIDFLTINHSQSLIESDRNIDMTNYEAIISQTRSNNHIYLRLIATFSHLIDTQYAVKCISDSYCKYASIRIQRLLDKARSMNLVDFNRSLLSREVNMYFEFFINQFKQYGRPNEALTSLLINYKNFVKHLNNLGVLRSYHLHTTLNENNLLKFLFAMNSTSYNDAFSVALRESNDHVLSSYINIQLDTQEGKLDAAQIDAIINPLFKNSSPSLKLTDIERIQCENSKVYALIKEKLQPYVHREQQQEQKVYSSEISIEQLEAKLAEMSQKGKNIYPTLRRYIVVISKIDNPNSETLKRLYELCKQLPKHEYVAATYASLLYAHSKFVPVEQSKADYYYKKLVESIQKSYFECDTQKVLTYCEYKLMKCGAGFDEIFSILSSFKFQQAHSEAVKVVSDFFLHNIDKFSVENCMKLYNLCIKNNFIRGRSGFVDYLIINKCLNSAAGDDTVAKRIHLNQAIDLYKSQKGIYSAEVDILREVLKLKDKTLYFEMLNILNERADEAFIVDCLIYAYLSLGKYKKIDSLLKTAAHEDSLDIINIRNFESYLNKCTFLMRQSSVVRANYDLLLNNLAHYLNSSDYFRKETRKKSEIERLIQNYRNKYS